MGPIGIIIATPRFDDLAGHRQAPEHMLVEAFVPKPAVETFDESVLDRLARRDVVPADASLLLPACPDPCNQPFSSLLGEIVSLFGGFMFPC